MSCCFRLSAQPFACFFYYVSWIQLFLWWTFTCPLWAFNPYGVPHSCFLPCISGRRNQFDISIPQLTTKESPGLPMQYVNIGYLLQNQNPIKILLQPIHRLICKSCKWQEDEFLKACLPRKGTFMGSKIMAKYPIKSKSYAADCEDRLNWMKLWYDPV